MKLFTTTLVLTTLSVVLAFGQASDLPFVDDMKYQRELLDSDPALMQKHLENQEALRKHAEAYAKHGSAARGEAYVIPVVFHVIHEGGPENISDEQIEDAVRIMTRDFNAWNPDTAEVDSFFKDRIGNAEIEFRLAKKDEFGNPSSGITRHFSDLTNNAGENVKREIVSWDRSMYMQIWVVASISGGAAGYTFYPGSAPSARNDGIIVLHDYVGSIGTGSARRSRTLTHEVGHWLNLPHCWGSTNSPGDTIVNCSAGMDDGVSDTPHTAGWRSCNLNGHTCGSKDNVENYMEYSYCSKMFTNGQAVRMRAAVTSPVGERNNLITGDNHNNTGIVGIQVADWKKNKTVICAGEAVTFTDNSHYDQNNWDWTFEGATPSSSTDENPSVSYPEIGSYSVSLTAGDGIDQVSNSRLNEIHVLPKEGFFTPYNESFENPFYVEERWLILNGEELSGMGWRTDFSVATHGVNSLVNQNFGGNAGRVDEMICHPMDWSAFESAELRFHMAFRQRTQDDNDKLKVYVSNDCGATWNLRWVKSGTSLGTGQPLNSTFIPNASEFVEVIISEFLEEDMVENVLVKLEFESGGGNDLYIDDLLFSGIYHGIPVLNFPENGADSIDANVLIDWKPILGMGGYEVQLDTTPLFGSSILLEEYKPYLDVTPWNEDTELQTSDLEPGETYFWRVRSYFNDTAGAWSPTWSFTVSPTGEGLDFEQPAEPDPSVGLEATKISPEWSIYPNPADQGNSVYLIGPSNPDNILVMDASGRIVRVETKLVQEGEHSTKYSLDGLKAGFYSVLIDHRDLRKVYKLVIQ